jgi:hypothetical protein
MSAVPRLPDAHLAKARELVAAHRRHQRCRHCLDRGYVGTNQNNMLVPCVRCVDEDAVMGAWRQYVRETPELTELYGSYFEPDSDTDEQGPAGPSS